MKPIAYPIFWALFLTGCAGGAAPGLPASHPANPQARRSPVAPATPTLLAGARGLVRSLSTNQTGMQHEHHQAPSTHKPPEHHHEHEQPKKEDKK